MDQDKEKQSQTSFNPSEMKESLIKLLSYNKHITSNVIDLVFEEIQFKYYQKDDAIYQKGQQIEELSILMYGKVGMFKSIYNKDLNIKEDVLIQEFQKGGVLGLKNLTQAMSSFEEYTYISLSSCQVAVINKNAFNQHLKKPFENFIRDVVLFLKQISLFNCISYNKLQQNCYYISIYQAQRGQVIYQLEEPHRDFYVLLEGSVASYQKVKLRTSGFSQFLQNLGDHEQKLLSNSTNILENNTSRSLKQAERMVKIREYHQGEFFGEQEIIQNKKRQFTILSEGNCIILRFTPYMFQKLIKEDQECWNILQHQTQVKEKLIEQRNQKFQASLKIVNENNDLIMNRNNLNFPINSLKNTNFKGGNNNFQFLIKQSLQTLQAQTDESINTLSNQDMQFNTSSPKNPKSLIRLDSQTRLSNTQCSTHAQSLTSRLTESQQSPFSSSQASPFQRKGKKNLSMIPLQSLNIINENELKDAFIKNSSLKEIDLNLKKNQYNLSSISPIQKPQNKIVRSLNRQWTALNLNSENTVNTIQLNESKDLIDTTTKKRNSSTNNIFPISSPQINDSTLNIQTDARSKLNTQKRQQRPCAMKERISSQDFIFDKNKHSTFGFNNQAIDSVSDLLKMKQLSGRWQQQQKNITEEMFQKQENGKFISNMIQKLKIAQDTEQQTNQKQKQVGIIDKHTENFALNLKNVFYRVFNKKNITQEETQKGLEKQVIDEGIKKYIKLHSSIQTNKNQVDYLKQKRLKYNDQLANVIYGRVKNYVEKKKEDDQVSNTPRIITYKSPSQILQQGYEQYSQDFILNEEFSSDSNKIQLKFPFSLTPLKYKSTIKHTCQIEEKDLPDDDEEIDIKSIQSPRVTNIEYKQFQDQIASPIHIEHKKQQSPRITRKQQAEITQQVYPLNMVSESIQSSVYKSYSPNTKAIQSKKSTAHAMFRNNSKNSLKLDPSTICLLKRYELNLSLKNKFHTVSRSTTQIDCQSLQNSGVFKVTQLKNNQQQLLKTLKQNRINNC
ncbi:cyclic nucleotide-binding domain protein (macronuclear) [Tetrahymena thermophila SB210]|uniref:Cyclic nucleotide-binding domain protein n=1 Tax=Tetrahymena thermophila (strain SB210) TaxID=312017 RepID=Q24E64_TETTS|nr:cyclic nucleotide-binding domain protein [Tetrahymena thermophila SB210]EAS06037.2 cyclic nucleotide-binding domain protein [Tetrahymena thermophila SB210]|eukprot:XP_001026282.2 cyclic nucleotide-binding domain protein [Tetrahymena thermophila SB210]